MVVEVSSAQARSGLLPRPSRSRGRVLGLDPRVDGREERVGHVLVLPWM